MGVGRCWDVYIYICTAHQLVQDFVWCFCSPTYTSFQVSRWDLNVFWMILLCGIFLAKGSFSDEAYETLGEREWFPMARHSRIWEDGVSRLSGNADHIPDRYTKVKDVIIFRKTSCRWWLWTCFLRCSYPVQLATINLGQQIFHPSDATNIKYKLIPLVMTQLSS